ncbi:MAG: alpha/beta hydrolase [Zetaproteobacteria bacterium]|nr:MAG: alpha/beta hydrolase [Zetaproteobacteria bacterium]
MEKSPKSQSQEFIEGSLTCKNSEGTHKIVYSDWGHNNTQVIVCIHGLTGNGHDFDYLARHLVQYNYRVIAIDLAGRGRSDFLPNPLDYNYKQYNQDIMDVLTHLNLNKPNSVDWLGVSLGGMLGIAIAGFENTPIRRLILNDIGPEIPKKAVKFIARIVRKLYKFKNLAALEKRMRKTRGLTWGPITDEQWKHMAKHNFRDIPKGKISYAYDEKISRVFKIHPAKSVDLWDLWDKITCPTLALRGEKSFILPPNVLDRMKETATKFTLDTHVFEKCGHVPSLMAPNQIAVIEGWLKNTAPKV